MRLNDFLKCFKGKTDIEIYDYRSSKKLYIGTVSGMYKDKFKVECLEKYEQLLNRDIANSTSIVAHDILWLKVY